MRSHLSLMVPAAIGAIVSIASAAPVFRVSGPATNDNPDGNAWLNRVNYGGGLVLESTQFVYPSRVAGLQYNGGVGEMRVIAGSDTTHPGTKGVTTLEGMDGDSGSISTTDIRRFQNQILDAFSNNNLNHLFDIIPSDRQFRFHVHFDQPIVDNDAGPDNFGEVVYFERGGNGSNSFIWLAIGSNNKIVGKPYLVDPDTTLSPTPTNRPAFIRSYDPQGNPQGVQQVEGLALDISEAFGVTELSAIRVMSVQDYQGLDGFTGWINGEDDAPDMKMFAVQSQLVPEPAGAIAVAGLGLVLSARRRRR